MDMFSQKLIPVCLFVANLSEGVFVYVLFWVVDIIVAASTDDLLEETKDVD